MGGEGRTDLGGPSNPGGHDGQGDGMWHFGPQARLFVRPFSSASLALGMGLGTPISVPLCGGAEFHTDLGATFP